MEYDADMSDEVSFQENDLIGVLDKEPNGMDDGWWLGHVVRTGHRGTFLAIMTTELAQTEVKKCAVSGIPSMDDYTVVIKIMSDPL